MKKDNQTNTFLSKFSLKHPKLLKFLKSNVKAFLITGVIVFAITASATAVKILHSRQVRYKNSKSVETAINELYEKVDDCKLAKMGCKGCTKLEYIQSTGSQYIDTEYIFKDKPKVVGEIRLDASYDLDIMGTATAKQGNFIIDFAGSSLYYRYSSSISTRISTNINVGSWYNFEFSDKVIVDGVEKGSISSYDFSSNDQSFLIGRGRNFGVASFKKIKMYDGDTLVRDLVPYYKKSIDQVGMIDKVNDVFYENKGSGEFLYK